jgi:putative membrane protein
MKLNRIQVYSVLIVLFHAVGLTGFLLPEYERLFIKLVPFHLLLMLLILIFTVNDRSADLKIFALIVYCLGFLVELIGVNTGLIFGEYTYGNALGVKLWATPLMIGVNWMILVYSAGVFLEQFKLKSSLLFSALGALILTAIDLLIEPVAVRFDYWFWNGGIIPVRNYIGWYLFSFLLFMLFRTMNFRKENKVAVLFLFVQTVFFLILNITAI